MTTAQKIAIALALLVLVGFFAYRTYRDGGLDAFRDRMRPQPSIVSSTEETSFNTPTPLVTPTPVTGPAQYIPPSPAEATAADSAILAAMNSERVRAGVPPLQTHATLQALAQAHANDMAARSYFSHTNPEGVTFQQRLTASGYAGTQNAENLGLTSGAASSVVAGWMNSEGHRLNMLNASYVSVGVGTASGVWQGVQAVFAVAVFGNVK